MSDEYEELDEGSELDEDSELDPDDADAVARVALLKKIKGGELDVKEVLNLALDYVGSVSDFCECEGLLEDLHEGLDEDSGG